MSAPSGRFFFCYIHGVTIFYIDVQKYIVTNTHFVNIFSYSSKRTDTIKKLDAY